MLNTQTQQIPAAISTPNWLDRPSEYLCVYGQPIISLADGTTHGIELLARAILPGRGLLTPDQFIPQLKQQGRMHQLDNAMLCEAIFLFEALAAHSFEPPPWVSINVSPCRLADCNYLQHVLEAADSVRGIKGHLQLEVTEEKVLDRSIIPALESLREAGVKIAIDDLGAGYASISYLSRFPWDSVKFDRQLIKQVPESTRACVVLKSLLAMCQELGLKVVVEGVECNAQRDWLSVNGCEFVQGFLWHRPMPRQRWVELLALTS